MRTFAFLSSAFFILGCSQTPTKEHTSQPPSEPLKNIIEIQKKEAGFTYGIAYTSSTLTSKILEHCKKYNEKKYQDTKVSWLNRNAVALRAADFMMTEKTSDETEKEFAKLIISTEADITIEKYLKEAFANQENSQSECKKQITLINSGRLDVTREANIKKNIDLYIDYSIYIFRQKSHGITTDEKVYKALAASIAFNNLTNKALNYCKTISSDDAPYDDYLLKWKKHNDTQALAAKLLANLTYQSFIDTNNFERADSFKDFIKNHSASVETKGLDIVRKSNCAQEFKTYDYNHSLTTIPGYEREIDYIYHSYKVYMLTHQNLPLLFDM